VTETSCQTGTLRQNSSRCRGMALTTGCAPTALSERKPSRKGVGSLYSPSLAGSWLEVLGKCWKNDVTLVRLIAFPTSDTCAWRGGRDPTDRARTGLEQVEAPATRRPGQCSLENMVMVVEARDAGTSLSLHQSVINLRRNEGGVENSKTEDGGMVIIYPIPLTVSGAA
jgi:hypothetical protein